MQLNFIASFQASQISINIAQFKSKMTVGAIPLVRPLPSLACACTLAGFVKYPFIQQKKSSSI
jgi:hypothetical protein